MSLTSYTFDQLINFTRTTSGTYTNSSGLIATTPASVNLLTYTQEFDSNAAWTKNATTVTANSTTAPDTTSTADTLTATATTAVHNAQQVAGGSGSQLTLSVYVKAGTSNFVQFWHGATIQTYANFNLSTGAVGTVGTDATASITSVGNGWYRCSMTFTPAAAGTTRIALVTSASAAYNESWAAAGTESIFIWGAQLELGSTASTYTKNVGGLYPPRFDYDPVTLAPKGILIEGQRTNLLLQSQDFTNAAWSKTNINITADDVASPDGTTNADRITATGTPTVLQSGTVAATSATYSIYVKKGSSATTGNRFLLRNATTATNLTSILLNYDTGAITYSVGSSGASATSVGNGWWRLSISVSSGITSGDQLSCYVGFAGGGSVGDFMYAYGAQLEAGAFATSYIPTVASTVTRTADVAVINAPMFSPWYNQSAGTFVAQFDTVSGRDAAVISVNPNTNATYNRIWLWSGAPNVVRNSVVVASSTQSELTGATVALGATVKAAAAYKTNDFAFSTNGGSTATGTSGAVPSVSRLDIGNETSALSLNGHIRSITYYPVRLSDAQLQALTA